MKITNACIQILDQLTDMVNQIEDADFAKPSDALNQSTLGQHLRHTLEFFICLEQGVEAGIINYDERAHDPLMESDKFLTLTVINRIYAFVKNFDTDKALMLEVGYDLSKDDFIAVETNATRELVYNIEHAVHHMAIMKIGIREIAPYIQLPPDFGVAASTVRYKEAGIPQP
jgi:hypothetical protein